MRATIIILVLMAAAIWGGAAPSPHRHANLEVVPSYLPLCITDAECEGHDLDRDEFGDLIVRD